MSDYTSNYNFELIDFNLRPWSEKEHNNWLVLDRVLAAISIVPNIKGIWTNSTSYAVGDNVLDGQSLVFYACVAAHLSRPIGLFSADREINPTRWQIVAQASGAIRYDQDQVLDSVAKARARANIGIDSSPIASLKAPNGYQKFDSGIIAQFGSGSSSFSNDSTIITFPTAFPTLCTDVQASIVATLGTNTLANVFPVSITNTGFVVAGRQHVGTAAPTQVTLGFRWSAWGY